MADAARASLPFPADPVSGLQDESFFQVDLRVSRPFVYAGGDEQVELFVQVFNQFDRFNAQPFEGTAAGSFFGEPVGQAGPPRTVEVGLSLGF